jgi:hypothetical protein
VARARGVIREQVFAEVRAPIRREIIEPTLKASEREAEKGG